ncbi:hypothetical protein CEUSTIGMA_g3657.t1 [Chlamydomonas eustigma]|uniref:Uncharacterized protein n=1 Tax=Chlamydomonas eustigma TaxID=1157962 RepID=A0A250WZE2_9CHLO|nr:hypothetical protein CEUSTIGMA_g3657.t1 [Chlamydomonas eustigma]|eukprot:GAX76213.1 hypothetical protein CEUSTIGMA_g3657.t1 [Chlamydomonas eustigma]
MMKEDLIERLGSALGSTKNPSKQGQKGADALHGKISESVPKHDFVKRERANTNKTSRDTLGRRHLVRGSSMLNHGSSIRGREIDVSFVKGHKVRGRDHTFVPPPPLPPLPPPEILAGMFPNSMTLPAQILVPPLFIPPLLGTVDSPSPDSNSISYPMLPVASSILGHSTTSDFPMIKPHSLTDHDEGQRYLNTSMLPPTAACRGPGPGPRRVRGVGPGPRLKPRLSDPGLSLEESSQVTESSHGPAAYDDRQVHLEQAPDDADYVVHNASTEQHRSHFSILGKRVRGLDRDDDRKKDAESKDLQFQLHVQTVSGGQRSAHLDQLSNDSNPWDHDRGVKEALRFREKRERTASESRADASLFLNRSMHHERKGVSPVTGRRSPSPVQGLRVRHPVPTQHFTERSREGGHSQSPVSCHDLEPYHRAHCLDTEQRAEDLRRPPGYRFEASAVASSMETHRGRVQSASKPPFEGRDAHYGNERFNQGQPVSPSSRHSAEYIQSSHWKSATFSDVSCSNERGSRKVGMNGQHVLNPVGGIHEIRSDNVMHRGNIQEELMADDLRKIRYIPQPQQLAHDNRQSGSMQEERARHIDNRLGGSMQEERARHNENRQSGSIQEERSRLNDNRLGGSMQEERACHNENRLGGSMQEERARHKENRQSGSIQERSRNNNRNITKDGSMREERVNEYSRGDVGWRHDEAYSVHDAQTVITARGPGLSSEASQSFVHNSKCSLRSCRDDRFVSVHERGIKEQNESAVCKSTLEERTDRHSRVVDIGAVACGRESVLVVAGGGAIGNGDFDHRSHVRTEQGFRALKSNVTDIQHGMTEPAVVRAFAHEVAGVSGDQRGGVPAAAEYGKGRQDTVDFRQGTLEECALYNKWEQRHSRGLRRNDEACQRQQHDALEMGGVQCEEARHVDVQQDVHRNHRESSGDVVSRGQYRGKQYGEHMAGGVTAAAREDLELQDHAALHDAVHRNSGVSTVPSVASSSVREAGNSITLHHLNDMVRLGFISPGDLQAVLNKEADVPAITQIQLQFLKYRTMLMSQQQQLSAMSAQAPPVSIMQSSTISAQQPPPALASEACNKPSAFPPGFSQMGNQAVYQSHYYDQRGSVELQQGMEVSSLIRQREAPLSIGQTQATAEFVGGYGLAAVGILQPGVTHTAVLHAEAGLLPAASNPYQVSSVFLVPPESSFEQRTPAVIASSALQSHQRFTTY